VVGAFVWLEAFEQGSEAPPCGLLRALCGLAQQMFELSEPKATGGQHLFDRIEVGAVWRQEQQPRASGPDGAPDGGSLVAGEVVEDDDVALTTSDTLAMVKRNVI
jgi:hypothetical protein